MDAGTDRNTIQLSLQGTHMSSRSKLICRVLFNALGDAPCSDGNHAG